MPSYPYGSTSTPGRLTGVAAIQLASGVINLTIMWWVSSFAMLFIGGFCTTVFSLGICPIGAFCGVAPWILIPFGLAEIIVGIIGLVNPKTSGTALRYIAIMELPALLFGGIGSVVAGAVSLSLLNDREVRAYLDTTYQ